DAVSQGVASAVADSSSHGFPGEEERRGGRVEEHAGRDRREDAQAFSRWYRSAALRAIAARLFELKARKRFRQETAAHFRRARRLYTGDRLGHISFNPRITPRKWRFSASVVSPKRFSASRVTKKRSSPARSGPCGRRILPRAATHRAARYRAGRSES